MLETEREKKNLTQGSGGQRENLHKDCFSASVADQPSRGTGSSVLTVDLAGLFWASAKPRGLKSANMEALAAVFPAREICGSPEELPGRSTVSPMGQQ